MFSESEAKISSEDGSIEQYSVFLKGIKLKNSCWHLSKLSVSMINCQTESSTLNIENISSAVMKNSVIGNWRFRNTENGHHYKMLQWHH